MFMCIILVNNINFTGFIRTSFKYSVYIKNKFKLRAINCFLSFFFLFQHNYLMQFGYLPQSDIETGNLRTEESVRDAVRELQRFGGLPETGNIDAATRKLLATPRCGVPDKQDNYNLERPGPGIRRTKRYTLQGLKWDYTNLTWR